MNPVAKRLFAHADKEAAQRALFEKLRTSVTQLRSSELEMVKKETKMGEHYFRTGSH